MACCFDILFVESKVTSTSHQYLLYREGLALPIITVSFFIKYVKFLLFNRAYAAVGKCEIGKDILSGTFIND